MELIIALISGALGGTLAGKLLKSFSLGTIGDAIVGILGGGIGSYLLHAIGINLGGSGTDLAGIIGSFFEGGIGGGVLMTIIGLIRSMLNKA